ncbi:response regulator [Chroococcidiopsis sp. FACHB-1243]|uniref:response regulator n=1 Tax=Chroococcidiopsis sp. [FACHB-1243] TaxID=2692781 RepID=UPI00177A9378|nr:response regulator [Chroococcidiopsis sp. [FACHB-1243]]MBD2307724.1 response regulator [Chroococcidiopsis sp. [FACHB-1243]]
MRILLVEDDEAIAQALADALGTQNYVVDIAVDGEDGWALVGVSNYDLIVLDLMLPKLDGISLCRKLRQERYQMPILLLTAKDTKTDKVMGLDAGADDYVVKPFDFEVLTARIRALLRRGNAVLPPVLNWGHLRLDPSSCEVAYNGQTLHLSPKEYALLELFMRNPQRVFSRGAIVEQLWALDDPPEEDTIKSHIKSLRQKLKAAGASKDAIETVYGLGYRLKPLPQTHPTDSILSQPEAETSQIESSWAQQQIVLAVAKAREDFKIKVSDRLVVLSQVSQVLQQGQPGDELLSQARQEAHKLAGTLGTFGFTEASRLAQEIEDQLQTITASLDEAQSLHLSQLVVQLQQKL